MGSLNTRHAFDPLDLTIIDRVYEVACAHIEARNLCDPQKCAEEEDYVRKWVFALAGVGPFDFDSLCDKVLANMVALQVTSRAA